jgi:chromosomal replication initiation ATPase DnaA
MNHSRVVQEALVEVAAYWGLAADGLNEGRTTSQVDIRAIAQWMLRERYGFSYPELGALFGKNHATVLHNVRRVTYFVAMQDRGEDNRLGRIARSVLLGAKAAAE